MMKWIWRGFFIVLVIFVGIGLYKSFMSIPRLLLGNVLWGTNSFQLEVKVLDPVEGLVTAHSSFQLLKNVNQEFVLESSSYPLSFEFCLSGASDSQSLFSFDCRSRRFLSAQELLPFMDFEQTFYLPNTSRDFSFQSQYLLRNSAGIILSQAESDVQELSWKPQARIRLMDGAYPMVNEEISPQDVVFAESRFFDTDFFFNDQQTSHRLVVRPDLDLAFRVSDTPPALFQWVVTIPAQNESLELCTRVRASPSQCYSIRGQVRQISDLQCGNGIVESGEECDDANQDDDDACTSQCVVSYAVPDSGYPLAAVVLDPLDDGTFSVFAGLEDTGERSSILSRTFFIRLVSNQGTLVSQQAIDGLPFLQSVIPSESTATVEFYEKKGESETVFHTSLLSTTGGAALVQEVKPAADLPSREASASSLDALQVKWLGSASTSLDETRRQALDIGGRRDFQTRIVVQSTFSEEVKVYIQLVDEAVSFTHTLPPRATEEIPISIPDFRYGDHRLVVYAVFPDGQKTADVLLPFEYLAASDLGDFRLPWQGLAIVVLCLLGFSYVSFRMLFLMRRDPS